MFIPVAKLQSIYIILAIVAEENFELHQINIKKVYLNIKLTKNKDIHIKQLPEYIEKDTKDKVYYLWKILYRLK